MISSDPPPRPRPLGALSQQTAALAVLAMPVLARAGFTPSEAMLRRVRWAHEHGMDITRAREVFRTRGLTRSKEQA